MMWHRFAAAAGQKDDTMQMRTPIALLGLALGLALTAAAPAMAQDALGRGNVLDANLNRLTGTRNASTARIDFRARNLLVTGDVAGGRGFRESVGYSAEGDFTGILGSNDLYSFRAGSALSSIGAIQYSALGQDLRFGQTIGAVEYRRSGFAAGIGEIAATPLRADELAEARVRLDQVSLDRTEALRRDRLTELTPLGVGVTEDGRPLMLGASSLQGLTLTPIEGAPDASLSGLDRARLAEDARAGREVSRTGIGGPAPGGGAP